MPGAPLPIVLTDGNGNVLGYTGAKTGTLAASPVPAVICDSSGNVLTSSGTPTTPTVTTPGYFFPSVLLFTVFDPTNIDPRGAGSISNCTSWKQFYLPFQITVTRYRFQMDAGTFTGGFFYAGLYDNSGNLLFDIGKIDLSAGAGQYGPGAAHDPGTVFFDASRNATSSVTLQPGWYYYGWGASVTTGSLVFPQMGDNSSLWAETVGVDTTGLTNVASRWAHSSSFDISNGHLPTTIRTTGGSTTQPPNITFFA